MCGGWNGEDGGEVGPWAAMMEVQGGSCLVDHSAALPTGRMTNGSIGGVPCVLLLGLCRRPKGAKGAKLEPGGCLQIKLRFWGSNAASRMPYSR